MTTSAAEEPISRTQELAAFAATLDLADIPAEVVHQAERLTLDTCGCAIAGYADDNGKKFAHTLLSLGGVPEATFFGTGVRCPVPIAAFLNTQLSNCRDMDDNLLYHTHFANTSVLPALAVAEKQHASGAAFLASVIAAFEVTARITLSMPGILEVVSAPPQANFRLRMGSHAYNAIGAAVGAATVMGLGCDRTANAMGIAGYTSTLPTADKAFSEPRLTDMRYSPYGWLAWSGVLAALLASDGVTGDQRVLDGPEGFWRMRGADRCDFDVLTRDLGTKWWIMDTSFKPYPGGTWMRTSMMVLDRIVRRHDLAPEQIDKIVVHSWMLKSGGVVVQKQPKSALDTQVSYPYLLAMRALRIPPKRWQTEEVYSDPAVHRMMQKISLVHDPEAANVIYAEFEQWHGRTRKAPARVVVHANGRIYEDRGEYATGDPFDDETRLSDADLAGKFRTYADGVMRSQHIERAIEGLLSISSARDVAEVAAFLRP